jgi:hypothetical protein
MLGLTSGGEQFGETRIETSFKALLPGLVTKNL